MTTEPESKRLRMVTHKVLLDANDAEHAERIAARLRALGYLVSRERHEFVDRNGSITIDRHRVSE